jgi:hypothetical protein
VVPHGSRWRIEARVGDRRTTLHHAATSGADEVTLRGALPAPR